MGARWVFRPLATGPERRLDAGDRFVLTFLVAWGLSLVLAQAYLFMIGKSNPTAGVMGGAILAAWMYLHSNGRTIVGWDSTTPTTGSDSSST